MKTKIFLTVLFSLFIFTSSLQAQYNGKKWGVAFGCNYTTSSKLYLSPYAVDQVERSKYENLDDVYSYSAEIRYRVSERVIIGLNFEYLKRTGEKTEVAAMKGSTSYTIEMDDGYSMVPAELSVYYLLPFSSDKIKFYMGGGAGIYYGNHLRTYKEVDVSNVSRDFAYGIQISIGLEYLITDYIAFTGGIKFRDPEFKLKSKYNCSSFIDEYGAEVFLRDNTFNSKINIDGVTFFVGLGFNLF